MPVSRKRKKKKGRPQHKGPRPSSKMQEITSILDILDDAEANLKAEQKGDSHMDDINEVVTQLAERFGRLPTEDEVYRFLMGTPFERQAIWDHGLPETEKEQNDNQGS